MFIGEDLREKNYYSIGAFNFFQSASEANLVRLTPPTWARNA